MVNLLALLLSTTVVAAPAKKPTPAPTPTPTPAVASVPRKTVTLTQKQVAELVLQQGPKTKEVNLKYQTYKIDVVRTLQVYDWQLNAETGFEYDKMVALLNNGTTETSSKYERYRTTLGLSKQLATTGTILGVDVSRLSQNISPDASITNPPPSNQTLDIATLNLTQPLLANSFGLASRANVTAAEKRYEAQEIMRANELEEVVLSAIRQYWNTYVSQENFKETVAARDRYKTLVDAVRRKTNLGYSTPGDLPQIQAEFEGREQLVKAASTEYLKNMEDLVTLLGLEAGTEVVFNVPKDIPDVPKLTPKDPQTLRNIRSLKLSIEAADENLTYWKSSSYPFLDFVGKLTTTGRDEDSEGSFSEMTSGNRPGYYVGLRFNYHFGSDSQNEEIINAKLQKDLAETQLGRTLSETQDQESQKERAAQAAYAVALSAERQRGYRDRAAKELTKTYNQGRTDISILITALNNFFSSEVVYQRAIGEYHISLNEWAAVRDELIADARAVDVEVK